MNRMILSRSVCIVMDKFIKSTVGPFIHLPRAGIQVQRFSHKSLSLVVFDVTFGDDHVAFRVQGRVWETVDNIFKMIDVVMMNQFAGNVKSA